MQATQVHITIMNEMHLGWAWGKVDIILMEKDPHSLREQFTIGIVNLFSPKTYRFIHVYVQILQIFRACINYVHCIVRILNLYILIPFPCKLFVDE